jgi:hypothetical protein
MDLEAGVFGEMQTALDTIWKAEPAGDSISRLVRARIVSPGLVAALGFLLLVSLVVTTALTALSKLRQRLSAVRRRFSCWAQNSPRSTRAAADRRRARRSCGPTHRSARGRSTPKG